MNWWGFGLFILLFFGLPLLSHIAAYRLSQRLKVSGQRTTGRIISVRSRRDRLGRPGVPIPTVRFVTEAGATICGESKGNEYLANARIGAEIGVVYDAAAPSTFVFERDAAAGFDWGFVWFLLAVIGLLTWLAVANPRGCARHPAARPGPLPPPALTAVSP